VASFEARQVKEVKDYVEREGIDCDFEETRVFDVCLHKAGRDKAEADFAAITNADLSTAREMGYYSDGKAEEARNAIPRGYVAPRVNPSRRSQASKDRGLV
jgi:hypothetical protein